ncbi:hypothetical protein T310_1579 [Rasamsonia emersonii CBS 393.64]|uniref:Endoplasmic reticulum-Golgi intermediate compartment protein n=1 Tax=Rasamsonia emersonii (strain ATCC 16479 / CBS 393.64 / IMI 116815) TaxID=1408163 RepID=A0A0F4Z1K9_RASE3|nr:hypothetical protein T310_1579 [Rasamsonia emersonii CBS 393.64]KKA24394.1 hypothetical protein T310_1579 [Rasamsonia emersonii CBS 393.64]
MNGYAAHGLDEDAFGEKRSIAAGLKTFDAFPKTKPSYTSPSRRGGQWTVALLVICTMLTISELRAWFRGTETQHFSVEKGVSHELQMNLDMVVRMPCDDVRVNVQDAAGDRILAGEMLHREPTSWQLWMDKVNREIAAGVHEYQTLNEEDTRRLLAQEEDVHVRHVLGEVRRNPRRKFPKGPALRRGDVVDSCRIYGSLEGNKVQGDFHVTARGHGYQDMGAHLDHKTFNFSHMITELSFGPHYPSLMNPLDKTIATTDTHYYKYQYFLNIVPTIYSKGTNPAIIMSDKYTTTNALRLTKNPKTQSSQTSTPPRANRTPSLRIPTMSPGSSSSIISSPSCCSSARKGAVFWPCWCVLLMLSPACLSRVAGCFS